VRQWIPASVAVLGLLVLPAALVSNSNAQSTGVPASVTSPGFGGRSVNGTPASVTSQRPNGATSNGRVQFFSNVPRRDRDHDRDGDRRHHSRDRAFLGGAYAVPVAVPYPVDSTTDAEDDSGYQGGPTVFDRRGSGADAYVPPVKDVPSARAAQQASSDPPAPEAPPDPTTLVFKDSHQLEVGNYAIVGQTLYDMTPGHPRKIALADLDLNATQRLNDEHGVSFQLPPTAHAN
jgi:hypothetical protein